MAEIRYSGGGYERGQQKGSGRDRVGIDMFSVTRVRDEKLETAG